MKWQRGAKTEVKMDKTNTRNQRAETIKKTTISPFWDWSWSSGPSIPPPSVPPVFYLCVTDQGEVPRLDHGVDTVPIEGLRVSCWLYVQSHRQSSRWGVDAWSGYPSCWPGSRSSCYRRYWWFSAQSSWGQRSRCTCTCETLRGFRKIRILILVNKFLLLLLHLIKVINHENNIYFDLTTYKETNRKWCGHRISQKWVGESAWHPSTERR